MKNPLFAPKWTKAILFLLLAALYLPFLWMIVKAFGGPGDWGLQWFVGVLENEVWMEAMGRSLGIALLASFIATVLGLGAAVASRSKLAPWLGVFSVASLVLPELVFALSLLSWFVRVGMELSLATVLISHVTFSLSFAYFLMLSRFRQIDVSLFEAAQDLGAGTWEAFRRVLLPLLLPAAGVSFTLCFLLSFDDFLISFFVSGVGSDTLPIKLYAAMKMGLSPQLHALATLMSAVSAIALSMILGSRFVAQFFHHSGADAPGSTAISGPENSSSQNEKSTVASL